MDENRRNAKWPTARVRFREFENTYLNYDVTFDRLFSIATHTRLS